MLYSIPASEHAPKIEVSKISNEVLETQLVDRTIIRVIKVFKFDAKIKSKLYR